MRRKKNAKHVGFFNQISEMKQKTIFSLETNLLSKADCWFIILLKIHFISKDNNDIQSKSIKLLSSDPYFHCFKCKKRLKLKNL